MKCLFCQFLWEKIKKHENNYPFLAIKKTRDIMAFLSMPDNNKETHLLVIPTKHYGCIESIQKNTANKLIENIIFAVKILKKNYPACNILLNNGKSAEQYIPHVHFHIIPKNKNGKNPWTNLNMKEFINLSKKLKKDFSS